MAKNAITDYSTTAASNTDVGGVDIQGSAPASNMDDSVRELMSHLAETNAGTSPWADTMTIADPVDLTKEARFDCGSITAGNTRVVTIPDADITLVGAAAPSFTTSLTVTSTDAGAAAGPDIYLYRNSASPLADDTLGRVIFQGEDSAGNTETYGYLETVIMDPTSTNEDAYMRFIIVKAGTAREALSIVPGGVTLDHDGSNFSVLNTNDDANVLILQGGETSSEGGQLYLYGDGHATNANDVAIYTANTERYRFIHSTGTHKFANTVASGTFSVTGATAGTDMTAGQFNMSKTGTGSNSMLGFYNANGLIGSITTSGSATAYNTSSDQRLKKNFRAAPAAGARIDQIKIHEYDWRGGGTGIGPKAQELHEVFPEAVTPGEGEPGEPGFRPWGWDASKLVPFLVLEIQSLRQRVAALETTRQT